MNRTTVLGVVVALTLSVVGGVLGGPATATQDSPTVVSSSVEHVGGTEPRMENVTLDVEFQNRYILVASLKADSADYAHELAATGADHSTTFEITLVLDGYRPRNLRGTANGLQWDRQFHEDGTVTVTIRARPMAQQTMTGSPTFDDWPEGEADRADVAFEQKVVLRIRSFEGHSDRVASTIDGTVVGTDALSVGTPALRRDLQGRPRLVVRVGGPHYTVSGDVNAGRYYAVLAPPLLDAWNVERPEQLAAWYDGNATDFTAERLDDGSIRIEMETHYSVGQVAVGPAGVPVLFWASRGGVLAVVGLLAAAIGWVWRRR